MREIDALRAAHGELSKRLFRVALTSLVLLFLMVLSFARALARVDGDEAEKRLQDIAAIRRQKGVEPNMPMLFTPAWDRLKGPAPQSMHLSGFEPDDVRKQMDDAVAALNALANSWFTLKLPFLFEIDLRQWILALPLLLWISNAYLWITRAKLKIVEELAAREMTKPETTLAFDRLTFGAAWTRLPAAIGKTIYLVATAGLLLYFAIVAIPMWRLLKQPDSRWTLRGMAAAAILLLTYYVAAWTLYVDARLRTDANAILGIDKPGRAQRLVRFLDHSFARVSEVLARCGRWLATPAAVAVLASLFTAIAHSCKGEPLPGHALFHEKDAIWFAGGAFFEGSFIPYLCRIYYAITLLLAITALLFGRRLGTAMRRVFIAAALFLYVDVVFVFPGMPGFWLADGIRILFLGIPLFFALRRGREVIRPWLIALYLPGLILAPWACATLVKMGMWGVPIYFAGFSLLAIVCTAFVADEVRAPAIILPPPLQAHPAEHPS